MKQLADYTVNDTLPIREWRPTHLQLRQYAEASGDYNPIHLDENYAKQAGLGGVIAHGMLTMAQVGAMLTDWIGDEGDLKQFDVRFAGMVRPGDIIICSGRVKEKSSDKLVCAVEVKNGKQQEVLSGLAVVALKELSAGLGNKGN